MKIYEKLVTHLDAKQLCVKTGNDLWFEKHGKTITDIMNNAPSGSGIDCGTKLCDESNENKLVFLVSYHHMDTYGYYDGWTEHTVIVIPSLLFGIKLKIGGIDKNQIKDYLYDVYYDWLTSEYKE